HAAAIRLEPGPHGERASAAMRELCAARSINPETVRLSFGMDPIGLAATGGGGRAAPWREAHRQWGKLAGELAADFHGPFLEADGRPYHDGGATEAQELGVVLATTLAYFRALEGSVADDLLPRAIGVTLSIDCDLFAGIAKLRAMRQLWRNLLGASSLTAAPLVLHAESSWRMMTAQDTNMNLLRTVAAAFAAGLGGADSITVLPHSLVLGLPDGFARRMARNAQIMLLEEAHLHRVGDPASGAGYVEALTQSLATAAWSIFQGIEKHGGMVAALDSGHVQNMVRVAAGKRSEALQSGRKTIIGVSEFQAPADDAPAVLDVARREVPELGQAPDDPRIMPSQRLSEPFEELQATGASL
ncbi:MAG: methylmalonyl-CoA mutase family protein, partial [Pseudomonadota bacterium]|nr:methylmalonyl-CoA mutase family protein [Pseudomonadota bacterium]